MTSSLFELRPVRVDDRQAVIELIGRVYEEYGEQLCLDDADSDLPRLPQAYLERQGEFVVLTADDRVIGCHAAHPLLAPGVCTFRRLYLDPAHRGGGHGGRLMQWAVDWARTSQHPRIEFWSDTRFRHAHTFFQRWGFQTEWKTRRMTDGIEPYEEYFFWRQLEPS